MAEETKPWCFDPGTQTLGELSEAQNAYIDQFQAVHDQITQEEWTEIVDPFNLENHELKNFNIKPTLEDWLDLYEPVDCWTESRKVIGSYNIEEEMKTFGDSLISIRNTTSQYIEGRGQVVGFIDPELESRTLNMIDSWKKATLVEMFDSLAILASQIPNIAAKYDGLQSQLDSIQDKLNSIPCSDITYFKNEWTKAVLKLAKPEADALEKILRDGERKISGDRIGGVSRGFRNVEEARKFATLLKDKDRILELLQKEAETRIEEAFADNLAYSEQCMLLTFLPELLVSNNSNGIPYVNPQDSNYPLKVDGDAFGFVNRLVVDPSQKELFELKPSVVSQLIPYIRLYKVEKDDDGVDRETRITFDTNITNDLGGSGSSLRRQRGYGVGMNSFTFSYDGTDPFSAKKAISARLSIFASTFDDLLRERDGFKYADLALKTGGIAESKKRTLSDIEKENAEKLNFRLKATVGWNVPRETFVGFSEDIRNAMYNSYITIYLTPTIHSFDFDETGAVTFDIEYLAYIEDAMAQRSFNIFSNLAKEQLAMESIVDSLKEMGCEESGEEFKKINKANEEFVSQTNLMAYSSLVSKLSGKDKIYYLNMTYDDVARILQNPDDEDIVFPKPYTNSMVSQTTSEAINKAADLATAETGSIGQNILSVAAVSQDNESIPYFYLEDMVAIAMENVEQTLRTGAQDLSSAKYFEFLRKKEIASINLSRVKKQIENKQVELKNSLQQFQQMRVMLGPIEVYSPSRNKASIKTTLANIPISLNYFFEFMSKKVLSKEILNYPINKFIKDLVNDLIKNFLNSSDCTRVDNSQKLNINSTAITAYNRTRSRSEWKADKPSIDDISYFLRNPREKRGGPVLLLSGKRNAPVSTPLEGMINYYVFSAGRKYPVDNYVGDRTADENVGIFHYILGRDKGIIKNISLEKTTTTGLKEVRFEQEGYNGLEQLREVYNVKVDSFLNVQTFPGTYIYVEPRGFSPNTTEDLTRYGIGGYHMITKTTHRIAPGDASTTIQAAWVASKEGKPTKAGGGGGGTKKRTPESNEKINKCVVGVIDLGRLITGRDGRDLTPRERGQLGQELYEAAEEAGTHKGIYTV